MTTGRIWAYADHVDTDAIIPACYLFTSDPAELASHCLEGLDSTFASEVSPGDVIVAGENFGCGSSREHAPLAIKAAGIRCVVASSFARIFYRNAINIGLPIVVCPEAVATAVSGQRMAIDLEHGTIENVTLQKRMSFDPFPPFMMAIIESGGLVAYTRKRLAAGHWPRERVRR